MMSVAMEVVEILLVHRPTTSMTLTKAALLPRLTPTQPQVDAQWLHS
jgi:hypothetical protein